jgi:uncharacterized peroxidase-related enzyme|tara:strand:+ start:2141 stop:2416 length:276 start_codon:yes stop_codon:yes gene_type:complete
LVEQLATNYRAADLSKADRAMLDYATLLTREPGAVRKVDIDRLQGAGFSDRAILDINLVTGYFAFVNRLADGLGVPLEEFWDADETTTEKS